MAITTIPTNALQVARFAGAVFGAEVGSVTNAQINADIVTYGGLNNALNAYYKASPLGAMKATDVAAAILSNVGLSSTDAYASALAGQITTAAATGTQGQLIASLLNTFAGMTGDATYGTAAAKFNANVTSAMSYTGSTDIAFGTVVNVVQSSVLTTSQDTYTASSSGTTITAPIINNSNTFQTGDTITGTGSGNNTLIADLGLSQNFAIVANTTGIQTINLTAEAQANTNNQDVATNNPVSAGYAVQVNAARMYGVTNWQDTGSRGDVVIENIQLPGVTKNSTDAQPGVPTNTQNTSPNAMGYTSDVIFTMRSTLPGSTVAGTSTSSAYGLNGNAGVNLSAFFDPQALIRTPSVSTTTVSVMAGNSIGVTGVGSLSASAYAATPLFNFPYTAFSVLRDGVPITLNFRPADLTALKAANGGTQAQFTTAMTNAVADYNAANKTNITVTEVVSGNAYTAIDSTARVDSSYTLTETSHVLAPQPASAVSWFAQNGLPTNNAFEATINTGPTGSTTSLITSKLVLDNVGLGGLSQDPTYVGGTGSAGGNVLIGSLATSGGVQEIDISVQRGSWNNAISSTNNTLQYVKVSSDTTPYQNQYLAVGASLQAGNNLQSWQTHGVLMDVNGFTDVQNIDASSFKGSILIGEYLDSNTIGKYLNASNFTNASPTVTNSYDSTVGFTIKTGPNTSGVVIPGQLNANTVSVNSVNLLIDPNVADYGNFKMTITGAAGNDVVNLALGDQINAASPPAVVTGGMNIPTVGTKLALIGSLGNQNLLKNITIDESAGGNNTITFNGAGSAVIKTGAGNDAVYLNNSGAKGAFIVNAGSGAGSSTVVNDANYSTVGSNGLFGYATPNSSNSYNAPSTSFPGVNETIKVKFAGYTTAAIPINFSATAGTFTTFDINTAVMKAINDDPVMSKLLSAQAGGNASLVIDALVDGAQTAPSFTFGTTTLSSAQSAAGFVLYSGNPTYTIGTATNVSALSLTGAADSANGVNNSTITDSGGNNVFVLSSTTPRTSSDYNTVAINGSGTDVIVNLKNYDQVTVAAGQSVVIDAASFIGNATSATKLKLGTATVGSTLASTSETTVAGTTAWSVGTDGAISFTGTPTATGLTLGAQISSLIGSTAGVFEYSTSAETLVFAGGTVVDLVGTANAQGVVTFATSTTGVYIAA